MEKSIKLVAFDMDGTVLDSKLCLPNGLFEMIESHPDVNCCKRQAVLQPFEYI